MFFKVLINFKVLYLLNFIRGWEVKFISCFNRLFMEDLVSVFIVFFNLLYLFFNVCKSLNNE